VYISEFRRQYSVFNIHKYPLVASLVTSNCSCRVIGRLRAASGRVTHRDRHNTNQSVRTQGTIELTKMSGYLTNMTKCEWGHDD